MPRPYIPRIRIEETVEVPSAWDMEDEIFIKHLERRHSQDTKIEGYIHRHSIDVWIGMYRTFHDRIHDLSVPGQQDHTHEEEE